MKTALTTSVAIALAALVALPAAAQDDGELSPIGFCRLDGVAGGNAERTRSTAFGCFPGL